MPYKDPKRRREFSRLYYHFVTKPNDKGQLSLDSKKQRQKIKLEVMMHYSPGKLECACPNCDITEIDFLTMDHMNNDGAEHRRKIKYQPSGKMLYYWLKRNNYPQGFQVLCWNCNCTKAYFGSCPYGRT